MNTMWVQDVLNFVIWIIAWTTNKYEQTQNLFNMSPLEQGLRVRHFEFKVTWVHGAVRDSISKRSPGGALVNSIPAGVFKEQERLRQ